MRHHSHCGLSWLSVIGRQERERFGVRRKTWHQSQQAGRPARSGMPGPGALAQSREGTYSRQLRRKVPRVSAP